ncbi:MULTISPECIES: FAD-dependent oxidoreductase [unclassified Caballeronia]|uniref:FAD-dependent oxidoreductase n=1 Tax=unclassified Caballeronia TaxID=2646786 RepID=UPI00285C33AE|nr:MULTISPECIES: FAD-dependent oxidoreductase [unclassified Caballeronia]MDR5777168.1 FAD-binding protein [Caballeronia sp. LZ002]MDR5852607.1 FAD-binding protein [Caballeronia sp. LZ003]
MSHGQHEIIVVGGGIAGLVTAVRAAQSGRKIAVLERLTDDRYVCNTRLTGGVFHCALNDVRTPAAELTQIIEKATEGTATPELAAMLGHNAKRAVEWLQSLGIRFVRGSPDPWHSFVLAPPNIAQLGRNWQGRAGDVLLRSLETELLRLGGTLLRGHEARSLVMEGERCTGVRVISAGGENEFSAQAVVLADGGFQANRELLAQYVTRQPDQLVQRNAGSGVGSGLRMALEVGAALGEMSGFYGHVLSRDALVNDMLWPYPWLDELLKNYLVVGADGQRFVDEGKGGVYVANQIAKLDAPASAWVICDETGWNGAGRERFLPPNPNLEKAGATVLHASTLDGLAAAAGLPVHALQAEVRRYNEAVASGRCDQLAPPRSTAKFEALPVGKAPFYAIPVAAGITYTMGGLRIDAHCRVLTTDGESFKGLYAVGSTTGGLEGGPRVAYVGGLIKAAVTGLVCAEDLG